MIETRQMTAEERQRMRDALKRAASPRITDVESLWSAFLGLIVGLGLFRLLHEFVFQPLLPDRSRLGLALSIAVAAVLALGSVFLTHRMRRSVARLIEPQRLKFEEEIREGTVEVHSADDVTSYLDPDQPAKRRDLVVRFPEGEIRVDHYTCEQLGISAPVSGWCRISYFPRSGQIVEFTTKPS